MAITGLALAGCSHQDQKPHEAKAPRQVSATVITVADAMTTKLYEANGTVKPMLSSPLSSKIVAKVLSVGVRPGDRVRTGQVLIRLDSRDLNSSLKMASANLNAASTGVESAQVAETLEARTSAARIAQANAQVEQAKAALAMARARLSLAMEGTRTQEKTQARLAVEQAKSSLDLATKELDRTRSLVDQGALARRELDLAQNAYNLAKAAYESAVAAEQIAQEGTRKQDIEAAREAVSQAEGALKLAEAGVVQAKAAALQVDVRRKGIQQARAQVGQSAAAVDSAKVMLSYSAITAPFDGVVTERLADPGSMASPGMPLLTIESTDYRLEAMIPEQHVGQLAIGGEVPIKLDALKGATLPATLTELVPRGDDASHSFLAKFTLPTDPDLKAGMFGRAQIPTGSIRAIQIPSESTWERDGLHYVFVVNPDRIARLRVITLGKTHGGMITVLSGLKPGEKIVTKGREGVQDGDQVGGN